VEEGETVKVGQIIALIGEKGEEVSNIIEEIETEFRSTEKAAVPPVQKQSDAESDDGPEDGSADGLEDETGGDRLKRPNISPRARRIAEEAGVDLNILYREYGARRIAEKEVREYLAGIETGRIIKLSGRRKAIADKMVRSYRETAMLTNCMEADVTDLMEKLRELKSTGREKISLTACFVKLVADALEHHPLLNATYRESGEEIVLHNEINIGCAVDSEMGLLVPVIKKVKEKNVSTIDEELNILAEKARTGGLEKSDQSGGTFTVSNVGMYGIDLFTPIINYPEVAILGVGAIKRKPAYGPDTTEVVPREFVMLCLTYDHKVIDGAPASRFLQYIQGTTSNPEFLSKLFSK
jgi:pyruvate dehydrogenase E2 component (dihydrolipoamide acetyltransferase)